MSSNITDDIRKVLELEAQAILSIPVTPDYEEVVEVIFDRVHTRGGKQHGDLGIIRENDVLLVLSNSGKTREILELVELTHVLHPHIPVVIITGNPDGPLARQSRLVLYTGNPPEACPLGLTPTTSATTMAVIGDVLVVLMMKKIRFTAGDYARRHHGGYLGEKSREAGNADR
jgi:arabinose-5-phosphate isomerase